MSHQDDRQRATPEDMKCDTKLISNYRLILHGGNTKTPQMKHRFRGRTHCLEHDVGMLCPYTLEPTFCAALPCALDDYTLLVHDGAADYHSYKTEIVRPHQPEYARIREKPQDRLSTLVIKQQVGSA